MRTARLGDHVAFLSGFAFKSNRFNTDGDGLPIVRIRDVLSGKSDTFYSGDYDDRYVVHPGDCLIGMDGEFNLAYWQSGTALLNQRVCKVAEVSSEIDRGYLARFLTIALKQIEAITPYVTVKHLSVKTLSDTFIPLPPIPAQKRIATILDAVDALRAKRRESIEQLDSLVQATFLEMFGDPVTNPKGWSTAHLGKVCIKITDGTHHSPPTLAEGVPYVTAKHIKQNRICFFDDPWFVDVKHHEEIYSRCDPRLGDVLYIKDGATTGIAAVNRYEFPFSMLSSVALLRVDPARLHAEFLAAWLNAPMTKKTLLGYMGGAAIRRLTLAKIKSFDVPLPPIDLQTRFASIVESIEQQKARLKAHLAELDTLFASLQSRAFNGELVA